MYVAWSSSEDLTSAAHRRSYYGGSHVPLGPGSTIGHSFSDFRSVRFVFFIYLWWAGFRRDSSMVGNVWPRAVIAELLELVGILIQVI